jgi:PPM family protein phosphatase
MPATMAPVAYYTHRGRRRSNQDAVLVHRLDNGAELLAVADGMGGHSAGEVASRMALDTLVAELEQGAQLEPALRASNARVFQSAQERPEWHGMGTTLVALLRHGDSYELANVGDSRAYLIDSAAIRQITLDHSYSAEATRSGVMTAEEIARSPWRNALTRSVGTEATVEIDVFGPFSTRAPHAILLCSDGLYKTVGDNLIREYVLSIDDLGTSAQALAALAYRRGSDDNISLAVMEFEALPRRAPLITLPLAIRIDRQGAGGASKPPPAAPVLPAPEPQREAPVGSAGMPVGPAPRSPSVPVFQPLKDEWVPRRRSGRRRRRAIRFVATVLAILVVLVAAASWLTG